MKKLILDQDEKVTETVKYGMPCFCYREKMFCYLWVDKKSTEPYILFVEGGHLHHPKLEVGNRSRMKIYRVNPNVDLRIDEIRVLLKEALDLYRKRIIKIKAK